MEAKFNCFLGKPKSETTELSQQKKFLGIWGSIITYRDVVEIPYSGTKIPTRVNI